MATSLALVGPVMIPVLKIRRKRFCVSWSCAPFASRLLPFSAYLTASLMAERTFALQDSSTQNVSARVLPERQRRRVETTAEGKSSILAFNADNLMNNANLCLQNKTKMLLWAEDKTRKV